MLRVHDALGRSGTGARLLLQVHDELLVETPAAAAERVSALVRREIDLLVVKGKRQPVRVFELLQERGRASDRTSEIKRVFEQGLSLYRQKKWSQAEQAFGFLKEKFNDETSEIFLRRIALFKLEPPPRKWDGVFDLSLT